MVRVSRNVGSDRVIIASTVYTLRLHCRLKTLSVLYKDYKVALYSTVVFTVLLQDLNDGL